METQVNDADLFETRNYQRNIIDACIERNSIVFLPTGSGKTYIAIQVIKHFSQQLEKKYSEGGRRSVFLVNDVALAKQQGEALAYHLPFKVRVITGEDNVKKESDWLKEFEENEILVMTAQCFHDAVNTRTFIKIQQINVIVFDECHHGRNNHVYHQLMQSIPTKLTMKEMLNLRIIGLSGMLIGVDNKINALTVADEMRKLENSFQSVIITVNNLDDQKNVLLYSTKARQKSLTFHLAGGISQSLNKVVKCLTELQSTLEPMTIDNQTHLNPRNLRKTIPKRIKDLINIFKDFAVQATQMGNFGSYLLLLSTLIQLELTKRMADSEKYRNMIKLCITPVETSIRLMEKELALKNDDANSILSNSSDKVRKLMAILKQFFSKGRDLQCIIFVQRRTTAKILYHIIKMLAASWEDFPLRPDFVVGSNNEMPESIEAILSKSYNTEALEKFNSYRTNCVVCTSVLEEGIDIQACSLVIMYDRPTTPRSYIQSSGRARDSDSDYLVMLDTNDVVKFNKDLINWKQVNETMKKQLIGKTLDRPPPTEEEIRSEQKQDWEPFITASGSELNALNSITILNQYCMTLPFDCYTKYRETYRRIDHDDGTCQVAIEMPISSMIFGEVFGDRKENIRLAKQHAAFEICKILIEKGYLTDKLTPISSVQKIEEFNAEYFSHWEKYKGDEKRKAGNKNNLRQHTTKVPEVLRNCNPAMDKPNFLYRIDIKPEFNAGTERGLQVFHKLLEGANTFGILTTKRIPRLCKIPLFQSFGKVTCEISPLPLSVSFENESELHALKRFHINIFKDILKVFKDFFVLDKTSYLIVPLDDASEINWSLVEQFKEIAPPVPLSAEQAKSMTFRAEDYLYKVLNPVYRESDQNYIVIDVIEHKNPLSPFPDQTKATTYADYYKSRDHPIHRNDQFLLEVKGISKNYNLFFPGAGASGENKKSLRNLREEYVPELCHNYKFPGDYWLKATFLPSICHRMHFLLIAEDLRKWLITESIDLGRVTQSYELDVDYGDYEERNLLAEKHFDQEELETLDNVKQILDQQHKIEKQSDIARKNTFSIWKERVPVDFDRNLLTVTEADIDYYLHFVGKTSSGSAPAAPPSLNAQQIARMALRDSETRTEIQFINRTNANSSIQQKDLIKVLTTANSGDVFDMERFETLGDAFLKFISSLFLFKTHDNFHEGHLSALKGKLVSNRNLFYIGNEFGLSKMLKSSQFCSGDSLQGLAPSSIIPSRLLSAVEDKKFLLNHLVDLSLSPGEMEAGDINPVHLQQFLKLGADNNNMYGTNSYDKSMLPYINESCIGDKVIADAVEALIGCVVSSTGPHSALKLCEKLQIIPAKPGSQNLLTEPIPPRVPYTNGKSTFDPIANVNRLERIIGYTFKNRVFLCQALTHTSYPIKDAGTYENLEFLGDAVLDFLITSYISEQCPKMSPGKLTDLRSALVNNITLACIVVRKELHKFLKAESRVLYEAIKKFIAFQEAQDYKVTGDVILMSNEDETSVAEAINVPKVLGDIFESIIGAVYLDSRMSLTKTWAVIYQLMKEEINEFMQNVPLQVVRRLYEHNKGSAQPKFYNSHVIEETGEVAVPVKFKCHGVDMTVIGIGKNRKVAKNAAAKRALLELEKK